MKESLLEKIKRILFKNKANGYDGSPNHGLINGEPIYYCPEPDKK